MDEPLITSGTGPDTFIRGRIMTAPEWFVRACRKALMWHDCGADIDKDAEAIWKEISCYVQVRGEAKEISDLLKY